MEHQWIWQALDETWPRAASALAVSALAALIISYQGMRSRRWRGFAAALCKLAVFALLLLMLLEPTSVTTLPKAGENDVLLLADDSASLALRDAATGKSIGETLQAASAPTSGWQRALEATFRVHAFSFSDRLHERADFTALEFKGTRSALGGSLESLSQRYAKQPVAAMLLFTDGNATDAAKLEQLLSSKPTVPIFPVALGLKEAPQDLALQSVEVTQTPFEDSPVALTAKIAAQGFGGEEITLLIRDEIGKTVHTEKHRLAPQATEHIFHTRFRPAKTGLSFYQVTALPSKTVAQPSEPTRPAAPSTEATMENNQRLIAIDRRTGPYRVLYISGRPNWEYKFLRRALEADNEVKLVSLIRMAKREPKFQWRGREGETSNPLFRGFKSDAPEEAQRYDQPVMVRLGIADKQELADGLFPKSAEELFGAYRAVILDDIEAAFFTQQQLDLLERYVSARGGSLLMLGGQESFHLGSYDHTPVGRMLPVYLDQTSAAPQAEDARFDLTREGWLEPWMRLRSTESDEEGRLASMPSFFSINQTTAVKPGASILATVTDGQKKSHPAWIVQRFGHGRVAAVTVADVWRWGLRDAEAHADMDKAWRQLMRWLVVDVPDRVELQAHIAPASSHEIVKAQVRVRDQAFRPQDDVTVKIEVQEPDGGQIEQTAEPSA
ncbi:MAG: glutamine amidotransferase, partial [Roseimicrobium sp.]